MGISYTTYTYNYKDFELVGFKAILGSFSALVSKWPVSRKSLKLHSALFNFLTHMLMRVVTDLDECALGYCGIHGCNNTEGGYTCMCLDGYLPDNDDHVCTGKI